MNGTLIRGGPMRRLLRAIRRGLLYLLYLIASVAAIVYLFFYTTLVRELRTRQRPATEQLPTPGEIDLLTAQRLGQVSTDKESHFVNFPAEKPPGVERICAFGDSFTRGSETGTSQDYPSMLQALLEEWRPRAFEVLNFGSAWHGFHQAYIAWEALSPRYGCDHTLIGPATFFPVRDTRFNHTQLRSPYFLHARYILEKDDVRLIDVAGETYSERFDKYFSFFPRLRYARWDRSMPLLLAGLVSEGREVENPFYYLSNSAEEEAMSTYSILLARMAVSGQAIVLGHYDPTLVRLASTVGSQNLRAVRLRRPEQFPYGAPRGHNSAWGNLFLAEQYGAILSDSGVRPSMLIENRPVGPAVTRADPGRVQPLASYKAVSVAMNNQLVGHFYSTGLDSAVRGRGGSNAFHGTESVELLALKAPAESLVDACFLPLRWPLSNGARVILRSSSTHVGLGVVRRLSPGLPVSVVDVSGLEFRRWGELLLGSSAAAPWTQVARGDTWMVAVGDRAVLRGKAKDDSLALAPLEGFLYRLRVAPGAFVPPDRLPESGDYRLVFKQDATGRTELPIGSWRKVPAGAQRPSSGP